MRCRLRVLLVLSVLAAFGACGSSVEPPTVALRCEDVGGRPVADAEAWWSPAATWQNRGWVPPDCYPWICNPHALLRRVGEHVVAGADGTLRVPPDSIVAVLAGERAALVTVRAVGEPAVARLDEKCWRITVLEDGEPAAGLPVEVRWDCDPDDGAFEVPLGVTDARGQLLVRVPYEIVMPEPGALRPRPDDGSVPAEIRDARYQFEVDGMYLPAHGVTLAADTHAAELTIRAPSLGRVRVRAPEWRGPLLPALGLGRVGKSMEWDSANCVADGEHHVGVFGGGPFVVGYPVDWPYGIRQRVAGVETETVRMALPPEHVLCRARVLDEHGAPLRRVRWRPVDSMRVRTGTVLAEERGGLALVLDRGSDQPWTLRLRIEQAQRPELLGREVELRIPSGPDGSRHDLGTVRLGK